jgi:hypothetical protein
MIEVIPSFEMTARRARVVAKKEYRPQSASPNAKPPLRMLQTHTVNRVHDKQALRVADARATSGGVGPMIPDGAARCTAIANENTNPYSSLASETIRARMLESLVRCALERLDCGDGPRLNPPSPDERFDQ